MELARQGGGFAIDLRAMFRERAPDKAGQVADLSSTRNDTKGDQSFLVRREVGREKHGLASVPALRCPTKAMLSWFNAAEGC